MTKEQCKNRSRWNKSWWANATPKQYKARCKAMSKGRKGMKLSKSHRKAMSIDGRKRFLRGDYNNPIRSAKISKALKGRIVTWNKKLSKATKLFWARLTPDEKSRYVKNWASSNHQKPNKKEKKLYEILTKYFPRIFRLNVKGKEIICGKIPDFINKKRKLIIELYGDYWHGELRTGKTKHEVELTRKRLFRSKGYKTLIIWERELKNENKIRLKVEKFI